MYSLVLFKVTVFYLQMQQTPNPAAHDPCEVPPRDEHSDAVMQVLAIIVSKKSGLLYIY